LGSKWFAARLSGTLDYSPAARQAATIMALGRSFGAMPFDREVNRFFNRDEQKSISIGT
jgi:hypothetical protein